MPDIVGSALLSLRGDAVKQMQTFRVVTLTALAKKTLSGQMYDPTRDDGRGVVRLSRKWGYKLSVRPVL